MTLHDLIWELDKIACTKDVEDPQVYIQVGNIQVPLMGVAHFPEVDSVCDEAIILGDIKNPNLIL